jgi:hypothetical protein
MPLDYSALMYDPVYAELGVPATFTGPAGDVALTVIDDTKPTTNTVGTTGEVRSVGPGAFARIPELDAKGIARDVYMDAAISFNGSNWTVRSYEITGSPNGEDYGEVRFMLKAAGVG